MSDQKEVGGYERFRCYVLRLRGEWKWLRGEYEIEWWGVAKGSLPVGYEWTDDCHDDPLNDHSRDRMHVIIIVLLDVITHH